MDPVILFIPWSVCKCVCLCLLLSILLCCLLCLCQQHSGCRVLLAMEMLEVRAAFRLPKLFGDLGKDELGISSLRHLEDPFGCYQRRGNMGHKPAAWEVLVLPELLPICWIPVWPPSIHLFWWLLLVLVFSNVSGESQPGRLVLLGPPSGATVKQSQCWAVSGRDVQYPKTWNDSGVAWHQIWLFKLCWLLWLCQRETVCHQLPATISCAFSHGASMRIIIWIAHRHSWIYETFLTPYLSSLHILQNLHQLVSGCFLK